MDDDNNEREKDDVTGVWEEVSPTKRHRMGLTDWLRVKGTEGGN